MTDSEIAEAMGDVKEEERESEKEIEEAIANDFEDAFGVFVSVNASYDGDGNYRVTVPTHEMVDELEEQGDYDGVHFSGVSALQFQLSKQPEIK